MQGFKIFDRSLELAFDCDSSEDFVFVCRFSGFVGFCHRVAKVMRIKRSVIGLDSALVSLLLDSRLTTILIEDVEFVFGGSVDVDTDMSRVITGGNYDISLLNACQSFVGGELVVERRERSDEVFGRAKGSDFAKGEDFV